MKTLKDYGYVTEKEFVKAAAQDPLIRLKFKEFISQLSGKIARLDVDKYKLGEKEYSRLTKIGMSNFNRAFNEYIKKVNMYDGKTSYKFSTYFVFWIRQSINDELDE